MILAVAFVNPLLLGGLGLAAAPIIIHLLSRRRFRRIEWGATRFLIQADKQNRRRVRFEQWLLVALRCLAMALLTLVLARPFVEPGWIATVLGGRFGAQRVLVIDDSASLANRSGVGDDFSVLRDRALKLVASFAREGRSDPIWVYRATQPAADPLRLDSPSAAGLEKLRTDLANWRPAATPARPRRVLERVAGDLAALPPSAQADVFILSDFQRTDWQAQDAEQSAFEPLRRLDPAATRVLLMGLSDEQRDNLAIVDVSLERSQTVAGMPAVVVATAANFGRQPASGLRILPEIDGAPLPAAEVDDVAPGQTVRVPLELTFGEVGWRELSLQLSSSDGFSLDQTRRAVVPVRDAISVLVVDGQPSSDPQRDEVHLLRSALAPPGQFTSGMRVEVVPAEALDALDLRPFDAIVLANVPAPGEALAQTLRNFVEAGGGMLITLGAEAGDGEDYNRTLYADGAGVLPAPLLGAPTGAGAQGVRMARAATHPITTVFPTDGGTLAESIRFRAYYRVADPTASQPASSTAATSTPAAAVLARFTDEGASPALLEAIRGRGRVVLFTSTVDLEWNDWARAADGSYLIAMLETVQYIARRAETPLAFLAGQTLSVLVSPDEYELGAMVRSPAHPDEPAVQARAAEAVPGANELTPIVGPPATLLGTYVFELQQRGGGAETRPVSVNLEPAESDLRSMRPGDFDAPLAGIPHEFLGAGAALADPSGETRRELWPALLATLIAVLMLEQLLAWLFGRPGHVRTTAHSRFSTAQLPARPHGASTAG